VAPFQKHVLGTGTLKRAPRAGIEQNTQNVNAEPNNIHGEGGHYQDALRRELFLLRRCLHRARSLEH